jgi:threonine dehydrogenase-like Zn-dependent dehydrogenase
MRAVTFQAPGEVQVDEVADPELLASDDVILRVQACGICGSDLHIYHGRAQGIVNPPAALGIENGDAGQGLGVRGAGAGTE